MLNDNYMENIYTKESIDNADISIILSEQEKDEEWDSFVEYNPGGFHEQTSMWGSVKRLDGWNPVRVKFIQNFKIRGGFQLLYKHKKYFGRIGYLSKGPLIDQYDLELWKLIINQLIIIVKQYRIKALIIIPTVYDYYKNPKFDRKIFNLNEIFPVINATLQIDLKQPLAEILRGMRKRLRTNLKNSDGLNFREGTKAELHTFFNLMLTTCRNQQVAPNPPTLESLRRIWSHFSGKDLIRLYFAVKGNEIVSGILALRIRDIFIAWKIGWSGMYKSLSPNAALIWEMIKIAKKDGSKIFDFVSVDYKIAKLIKRKEPLTEEVIKNHTFFKLGFGGDIIRLPDSYIYFSGAVLNNAYKIFYNIKTSIKALIKNG